MESCGRTSSGNSMTLYNRENRSTPNKVLKTVSCESSFTLLNLELVSITFLPSRLGGWRGMFLVQDKWHRKVREYSLVYVLVLSFLFCFCFFTGILNLFPWYSAPLMSHFLTAYFKNKHNVPCLHFHLSSALTKKSSDTQRVKNLRLIEERYSI